MEIKHVQPEATWTGKVKTLDPKSEPQDLELTLRFVALDEIEDYNRTGQALKLSEAMRKLIGGAITGWNLTENGVDIPCNDETKAKYLPVLFGMQVVKDDEPLSVNSTLVRQLADFAADAGNYLGG